MTGPFFIDKVRQVSDHQTQALEGHMEGSKCEHKIRLLRGALFEYLDDGMLDEMIEDMRIFFKEEEDKMMDMVKIYKKARVIICGDKE